MVVFTGGVFLATLLVFIPIYYLSYDFGDGAAILRPLLIAVHNSMRVFILDGEFDIIRDAVSGCSVPFRVIFSLYCAALYVTAPVLTFGNVLSLFQNFRSEMRFTLCQNRPIYIMSALNERSVTLSKSILEKFGDKRPVIVFTDVFEKNEEEEYELLLEARNLNAICLKKDAAHLNIKNKKCDVEMFLIGDDETENVSQAARITETLDAYGKKENVKVFVFATSTGSRYTIDSLDYPSLLSKAAKDHFDNGTFKLRRVDEVQNLVWNTVPEMEIMKLAESGVISVMIAGMGSYGMEFLKTLVWYCQLDGCRLEFNLFDKSHMEAGRPGNALEAMLHRQCPELIEKNPRNIDGDANYDIRCFDNVDFELDTFANMLLGDGEEAERLRRTSIVIVALGDDDQNIETAVYLRSLFDRVNKVVAGTEIKPEQERPSIFSVVYNEKKSGEVNGKAGRAALRDHKGVPYNINFIGSVSEQFSYGNIYDSDLEQSAFHHHISWSEVNKRAYEEMQADGGYSQEDMDNFSYYLKTPEDELKQRTSYERYEYFRHSSIAKEMHQRLKATSKDMTAKTTCLNGGHSQLCECENCVRRKKMEHNRWNAYMRSVGYSYGAKRSDRARLHIDLKNWSELSRWDRAKD